MRVTAELTLNSDGGFLRGYGWTAALTTYPPLSPSPTVGAAHNSPRPPPKRAKTTAKARASRANQDLSNTLQTPTPSKSNISSDQKWRQNEDINVTVLGGNYMDKLHPIKSTSLLSNVQNQG